MSLYVQEIKMTQEQVALIKQQCIIEQGFEVVEGIHLQYWWRVK